MDISAALSEPAVRLLEFHNTFNRNIKIVFGAIEKLSAEASSIGGEEILALPTGSEPWGQQTRWRNLAAPLKDTIGFLAETGIVRAAAAFEDYLVGAKAEFDRARLNAIRPRAEGTGAWQGLDAELGIDEEATSDLQRMSEFFDVSRNCVVHRSNRASSHLAKLRADAAMQETLMRWPKRVGKWTLSLPLISEGEPVEWRPRHAIMASDVYYRCAIKLDRKLVELIGEHGLVRMATHWCFFSSHNAPCPAKLDAGTMVRTQLGRRYKVRAIEHAETIEVLRELGMWEAALSAFEERFPDGPGTAGPTKRRARNANSKR